MNRVCVCLATRGRGNQAQDVAENLIALAKNPDTFVCIGYDTDDDTLQPSLNVSHPLINNSVADREDSLGAKYNRIASQCEADIYVLWADDVEITTEGWDERLIEAANLFPDQMGVIYFADIPGTLQTGIAVTRKFADAMGFFCTPYFPFWWHDTWIDEVGRLSGRIVHADIKAKLLGELKGASRGVQEIAFWGQFFDRLRPSRVEVAKRIIEIGDDPPYRKHQLLRNMPALIDMLHKRNSKCSDPASAAELEKFYSFDAVQDERYLRIKAAALKMMEAA